MIRRTKKAGPEGNHNLLISVKDSKTVFISVDETGHTGSLLCCHDFDVPLADIQALLDAEEQS